MLAHRFAGALPPSPWSFPKVPVHADNPKSDSKIAGHAKTTFSRWEWALHETKNMERSCKRPRRFTAEG